MGEVIPMHRDQHERLGLNALEALLLDRPENALRALVQAWVDASENREDALVIAKQINALIANHGPGAA